GASPRELLLEASRRNNISLLTDLLATLHTPEQIASLLNTATDGVGAYALHLAAYNGSYDVLDTLLDQEGVEVDPLDRLEGDTPLHKAVRYINGLGKNEWDGASALVELLLDAGADPREFMILVILDAGARPGDLVDSQITVVTKLLHKAEFASMAVGDAVDVGRGEGKGEGSASDSE
ncbi:MAG: hypothetical protein Q9217_007074, partial [Psora testacea]